uniref:Ig-like domain-containing protein n=1 Tax=Hucho hucho TaxID=62062 RepID=A0A4W5KEG2_9TELE
KVMRISALLQCVSVQGQSCNRVTYTKRRICVLKGSTVDISCTYGSYYYTTSSFWFRSDKSTPEDLTRDPGYAGRVKYTGTYKGPFTLRISDLREEDSAEYRFTFKTYNFEWGHSFPGTTLTVTGNTTLPSGEIVEGSSVTLTCSSDANPPVFKYTWYKKNGASLTGSEKTYNFPTISSEDSGEYYCGAENKYGRSHLNSYFNHNPSGEIVEGSSVTLTCSSDANPPAVKYTWYFQNKTFPNGFGQMYHISNFKSKDNGHYHCEAWNGRGSRNSTALMIILPDRTLDIQYEDGPRNTSVSVSPSGEIVEGSSVTLTCSSDANPPVQSCTWWYRKKGGTNQRISNQNTGPQHVFNQIQSSDSGEYYFEAQNEMGTDRSRTINMDTSVLTAAVGIIVVVLVLILCLSGFMWFR